MASAASRPPAASVRVPRLRASLTALGVIGLLGAVAILPILPWTMGIVTDVRHSYTPSVPADNRGAYLVTDAGAMQLFAWYVQPDEFPSDAPTLAPGAISAVAVVQKQHAASDDYRLIEVSTGRIVQWGGAEEDSTLLRLLIGSALPPGEYQLTVPTDSMFGGVTRHYFRVAGAGQGVNDDG